MQTTRFVVFQLADFLLFFFSGKYLIGQCKSDPEHIRHPRISRILPEIIAFKIYDSQNLATMHDCDFRYATSDVRHTVPKQTLLQGLTLKMLKVPFFTSSLYLLFSSQAECDTTLLTIAVTAAE